LSLPLIIQQIANVDAKVLELRERSRHATDDVSREFFRVQAGHFHALRADLEAMRITLENIEARTKAISDR
jgi:BMFP domain-containing protein YqiC